MDLRESDTSPAVTPIKRPRVAPPAREAAVRTGRSGGTSAVHVGGTSAVHVGTSTPSAEIRTDGIKQREAEAREGNAAGPGEPTVGPRGPPQGPGQLSMPGFVHCPVCGMTIREAILNLHLDK